MYQLLFQGQLVAESEQPILYSKDMQAWQIGETAFYSDPAREMQVVNTADQPPSLQEQIVTATQKRLDVFAQTRNYDDIKSASDYAGCSVPKFSVEGTYCRDIRAETWAKLYEMLAEVEAGTRPVPTGFADVEPELPALVWPNP